MSKILQIENLTKLFNNGKVTALSEVDFNVNEGQILAIIGESGSGKTTLARLITGLEVPSNGSIIFNDAVVSSENTFIEPEHRNIGMVFQEYALFPHFNVFDNVVYGISKERDREERVTALLDLVGLKGFEKRYPHELSGGQQQRVALARALAPDPKLLVLDEPFSNLDVILRNELRTEIASILRKTKTTAILITHDIKDAIEVSDEILILRKGKLVQKGTVQNIKNSPKSDYIELLFKEYTNLD